MPIRACLVEFWLLSCSIYTKHMKIRLLSLLLVFLSTSSVFAQGISKKVLFVGNSYVYTNNLPLELANIAASMSDEVIYDSNCPGGYTFELHSTNATTLDKIALGDWDFVVLQEQSQIPTFPIDQVETECFPFADELNDYIQANNDCAQTVFFMTWGRKNGDADNCPFWPPVCTYNGMDSLLNLRYRTMAEDNLALLSPVGQVWHYVRDNFPTIELYSGDGSHPSTAGTYAAAMTFYSLLFQRDPALVSYNGALDATSAASIRAAVKATVYDSLEVWHVNEYQPNAEFTSTELLPGEFNFSNASTFATDYLWDFGDGFTSTLFEPTHIFIENGFYNVSLTASNCLDADVTSLVVEVTELPSAISNESASKFVIYPNPADDILMIESSYTDATQFEIVDYLGRKVLQEVIVSDKTTINISNLPQGVYLIQFFVGDQSAYKQQLVIQ
jgi:hypothetical protein